jgi:hypothetical protein
MCPVQCVTYVSGRSLSYLQLNRDEGPKATVVGNVVGARRFLRVGQPHQSSDRVTLRRAHSFARGPERLPAGTPPPPHARTRAKPQRQLRKN